MAPAFSSRPPPTALPVPPPATPVWGPGTRTAPGAGRRLSISPGAVFPTVQPATLRTVAGRSVSPVPGAVTSVASPDTARTARLAGHWPRTVSASLLLPSCVSPASTEVAGPVWPVTRPAGPVTAPARRTARAATPTTNSSDQPAVLTVHQVRPVLSPLCNIYSCCQAPSYLPRETPVSAAPTPARPVTAVAVSPVSPDTSCR